MATFEVFQIDVNNVNDARAIGAGACQLNLAGRGGLAGRAYFVRR